MSDEVNGETVRSEALWLFDYLKQRDRGVSVLERKLAQRFVGKRLEDAKALAVVQATGMEVNDAEDLARLGLNTLVELDIYVVRALCLEVDEELDEEDVMYG